MARVTLPHEPPWVRSVYHPYVIRTAERDGHKRHLAQAGISTGIHYPIPLHLQEAYKHLGFQVGDFPVSEKVASEALSLPMYPTLRLEDQSRVAGKVIDFVSLQMT